MHDRALLLVNRKSRNGASNIDVAIARLEERGVAIIAPEVTCSDDIPLLIRRYQAEVDCAIVGGGDGTLNAAAAALVETGLTLGILPLGTANDLARTLGIPTDLEQACDIIVTGVRHRIDLGRVNGRLFFNVANIGLGVHVAHQLSPELKRRWGVLSYCASLVRAIRGMRPFRASIVCDGRRHRVRSVQIAVGNGRYYGGGVTVAAPACIDDARFFLYSVTPLGMMQILRMLMRAPALHGGRFADCDPIDLEQGLDIEIHTRRAMQISADGEIVGRTPAHFEMVPAALEVFVPTAYFQNREEILHVAQG